MVHHASVGQGVDRDGVAVAAAFRKGDRLRLGRRERLGQQLGPEQRARTTGPHVVGIAPHRVGPVGDPTLRVERRLGAGRHGGSERFPGRFLLAHQLQPHRTTRQGAGHQGCVARSVVGAVVPIATRTLHMHAAYALRRHAEHGRDRIPVRKDALGVGPDRHLPAFEMRHRARRTDRAVGLVGTGVVGREPPQPVACGRDAPRQDGGVARG